MKLSKHKFSFGPKVLNTTIVMLFASIVTFVSLVAINVNAPRAQAINCPDGFDGGSITAIENGSCADHQTGTSLADSVEAEAAQDAAADAHNEVDSDCNSDSLNSGNCKIIGKILILINALSGLVGVTIVVMIIVGGIQYSAAGDNPQATAEAKKKIINAIIALIMFIFMASFLQWLIPGGVLNGSGGGSPATPTRGPR